LYVNILLYYHFSSLKLKFSTMARRVRALPPPYDSDASYSPETEDVGDDIFDPEGSDLSGSDREPTEVDDEALGDNDGTTDIDVDDQIQLFGGNVHPPEYYRQAVENFNEEDYEKQDYSDGSLVLLNACEAQWNE
jgi:hypothetical protein